MARPNLPTTPRVHRECESYYAIRSLSQYPQSEAVSVVPPSLLPGKRRLLGCLQVASGFRALQAQGLRKAAIAALFSRLRLYKPSRVPPSSARRIFRNARSALSNRTRTDAAAAHPSVRAGRKSTSPRRHRVTHFLFVVGEKERKESARRRRHRHQRSCARAARRPAA